MTKEGIRQPPPISTGYNIVRSLQLEGRVHIPSEGCWPITSVRVAKGWGYPDHSDFPAFDTSPVFPPPEPPDLDQKAKKLRITYYMRTYTPEQCAAAVAFPSPVNAAFEITKDWGSPPGGRIPIPRHDDEIVGSHSVRIVGTDLERQEFLFDSNWGREWGIEGMGRLPFSYFEHRLIDAYYMSLRRPPLEMFQGILHPVMNQFQWGDQIPGEEKSIVHIRELYDASYDENIGWAIVAERGEWLDVHELFVRPRVRKRGNGRGLIEALQELSEERSKHLRFWVSFADIETRGILVNLLGRVGYRLGPSPERWAAYLGVRGKPGETYFVPPLPSYIPARPTASTPPTLKEVVAAITLSAALNTGFFPDPSSPQPGAGEPVWEYPSTLGTDNVAERVADTASAATELKPGTLEFDRKNTRRFELIEKKVDGHLTAAEEAEFQALQAEILAVTKAHFPRSRPDREGWLKKLKEGAEG